MVIGEQSFLKRTLTHQEWVSAMTTWASKLAAVSNRFRLPEIGQLKLWGPDGCVTVANLCPPEMFSVYAHGKPCSPATQGVFCQGDGPASDVAVWGFTRDGAFIKGRLMLSGSVQIRIETAQFAAEQFTVEEMLALARTIRHLVQGWRSEADGDLKAAQRLVREADKELE